MKHSWPAGREAVSLLLLSPLLLLLLRRQCPHRNNGAQSRGQNTPSAAKAPSTRKIRSKPPCALAGAALAAMKKEVRQACTKHKSQRTARSSGLPQADTPGPAGCRPGAQRALETFPVFLAGHAGLAGRCLGSGRQAGRSSTGRGAARSAGRRAGPGTSAKTGARSCPGPSAGAHSSSSRFCRGHAVLCRSHAGRCGARQRPAHRGACCTEPPHEPAPPRPV